jgi:2-methylcitrate dehydratase PrpD
MKCIEKKEYTADYLDPNKRSIANAIQIFYKDGNKSELIEVEYPIGHQRRRDEGIPKLIEKFKVNLYRQFDEVQSKKILEKSLNYEILEQIPVNEYMDLYWKN